MRVRQDSVITKQLCNDEEGLRSGEEVSAWVSTRQMETTAQYRLSWRLILLQHSSGGTENPELSLNGAPGPTGRVWVGAPGVAGQAQ